MSKKQHELSNVQRYAVDSATKKVNEAKGELQALLKDIASEHNINLNDPRERWTLTEDNKFLIKQDTPQPDIPNNKKKSNEKDKK